jgi:hypothetical protein
MDFPAERLEPFAAKVGRRMGSGQEVLVVPLVVGQKVEHRTDLLPCRQEEELRTAAAEVEHRIQAVEEERRIQQVADRKGLVVAES